MKMMMSATDPERTRRWMLVLNVTMMTPPCSTWPPEGDREVRREGDDQETTVGRNRIILGSRQKRRTRAPPQQSRRPAQHYECVHPVVTRSTLSSSNCNVQVDRHLFVTYQRGVVRPVIANPAPKACPSLDRTSVDLSLAFLP
jgi:hypothetical protein